MTMTIYHKKKRIHINQHVIKKNQKHGESEPVITCKTYNTNDYYHELVILGPCRIKYRPDNPLSCGAKVWIETHAEVEGSVVASSVYSGLSQPYDPVTSIFEKAHEIHKETWAFKEHSEIPNDLAGDLVSVADATDVSEIPLDDINDYLNGLDSHIDSRNSTSSKKEQ
jgi:hypothetical protein